MPRAKHRKTKKKKQNILKNKENNNAPKCGGKQAQRDGKQAVAEDTLKTVNIRRCLTVATYIYIHTYIYLCAYVLMCCTSAHSSRRNRNTFQWQRASAIIAITKQKHLHVCKSEIQHSLAHSRLSQASCCDRLLTLTWRTAAGATSIFLAATGAARRHSNDRRHSYSSCLMR